MPLEKHDTIAHSILSCSFLKFTKGVTTYNLSLRSFSDLSLMSFFLRTGIVFLARKKRFCQKSLRHGVADTPYRKEHDMTDQEKQVQVSPSAEAIIVELDSQALEEITGGTHLQRSASAPALLQGRYDHSASPPLASPGWSPNEMPNSPVHSPGRTHPAAVFPEGGEVLTGEEAAQFWHNLQQAQARANQALQARPPRHA
jgi:hypothetical protein